MSINHILIVEDDDKIRALLTKFLSDHGFIISSSPTISGAFEILNYFKIDLIILDIMLPDDTGFNFIVKFDNKHNTPIIILSALGHVDDKIYGLENGAVDYMTKPFAPKELLLRINNILEMKKPALPTNTVIFGDFIFNQESGLLTTKSNDTVHLTSNERNLLKLLSNKMGELISRDEICEHFNNANHNTIDTMINRLRQKIEPNPKKPQFLITERNKGYGLWS